VIFSSRFQAGAQESIGAIASRFFSPGPYTDAGCRITSVGLGAVLSRRWLCVEEFGSALGDAVERSWVLKRCFSSSCVISLCRRLRHKLLRSALRYTSFAGGKSEPAREPVHCDSRIFFEKRVSKRVADLSLDPAAQSTTAFVASKRLKRFSVCKCRKCPSSAEDLP